jgi:hypothetical protein
VAHVGDALADSAAVEAPGAPGIIVDLFAEGQLIPQLTQVSSGAWLRYGLSCVITGDMVACVSTVLVCGLQLLITAQDRQRELCDDTAGMKCEHHRHHRFRLLYRTRVEGAVDELSAALAHSLNVRNPCI